MFAGEKCVEFLLWRQTWLGTLCVHQWKDSILHRAPHSWREALALEMFSFIAASVWLFFLSFSSPPSRPICPSNFFPACVLVLISQRDFLLKPVLPRNAHSSFEIQGREQRVGAGCQLTESW